MIKFTYETLPDGSVLTRSSIFQFKPSGTTRVCSGGNFFRYQKKTYWEDLAVMPEYLPTLRIIPPQLLL